MTIVPIDELRARFIYEPETGVFRWAHSNKIVKSSIRRSKRKRDYPTLVVSKKTIKAHRAAFVLMTGRWPKQIDHVNGDCRDNRWANLRECEPWQNCVNRSPRKPNPFRRRGVNFRYGKYIAKIKVNGRYMSLGTYASATLAGIAYDLAAIKYHGEFARLNYPKLNDQYAKGMWGDA